MNLQLVQILSNHINKVTSSSETLSSELLSLAQSHQVVPIVYYQTKDPTFYQSYLQTISVYTQRKSLLSQITDALGDIPYFTVKGISVAQYYPVPLLRTMGDCDIVVHESDKERVKSILLANGFTYVPTDWDHMEWHFEKQGLTFEIHHRLLYDEFVNTEQEKNFTDMAWEYEHSHELDVNFHFVFNLIHLKKHLLNCGVGIRQFMDLAVMSKNASLDSKTVSKFVDMIGLTKFAGVCSALCLRWFGVALPVDTPELSEEFCNRATKTILANGVFGYDLKENKEKRFLNKVQEKGKFRLILSHIFPSYQNCCATPKYQWIKGKPYLLPVLWIYRFFWALLSGRSRSGVDYISSVANSGQAIAARNRMLADWGL